VGRVRNYYINTIMIKAERASVSISKMKEVLRDILQQYYANKLNKGSFLHVDVDPY